MTTTCNIILLGDTGVGKSAFVMRLVKGYFSQSYISTIGVDYCKYEETNGVQMVLQDGGELRTGILAEFGPEVWEEFQTNFIDVSK